MAASLAVFQALAPGDHVVLHRDLYFGVRELITGLFARWGLKHSFVDMRNIEELRKACRPETKLLLAGDPDQSPD
jgi:cystathionine beta-lyase/cystathionine gamma-synthase